MRFDKPSVRQKLASFLEGSAETLSPRGRARTTSEGTPLERAASCPKRRLHPVALASASFVIAAFGGGLMLAHFSASDTPSSSSQVVSSVAPELLYARPDFVALPGANISPTSPIFSVATTSAMDPANKLQRFSEVEPLSHIAAAAALQEQNRDATRAAIRDSFRVTALEVTIADSVRFALAAQSSSSAQQSDPLVRGYEAVEIAVVPEPSSGFAVAVIVAVLLVFGKCSHRRARTNRC